MIFAAVEKHYLLIKKLLNRYFKQQFNNLTVCRKEPFKLLLTTQISEFFQHLFMECKILRLFYETLRI
jgi:hypothetical protein